MKRENEEQPPFVDVWKKIKEEEPVPVSSLFRLSDLNVEELAQVEREFGNIEAERRRIIVRHLADISEDNFVVDFSPIFSHVLDDEFDQVRLAALDGLWDSSEKKLIPKLIQVVQNDASTEVRAAAIATLAHFILMAEWLEISAAAAKPIVTELLALLDANDTPILIRRAAVEALGASSHERVSSLIQEAYESDDEMMQVSAVFAMGNSADPRWLSVVIAEMESDNPQMRLEAARAAGNIGKSDALSELADLTEDADLDIQLAAIQSLGQIGGEIASRILIEIFDDPEKEALHEAAEDAMEEASWMADDLNFIDLDPDSFDGEINLN